MMVSHGVYLKFNVQKYNILSTKIGGDSAL